MLIRNGPLLQLTLLPLAPPSQSIPGARRMVVGHTIQAQGINSACEGRVYRVDVGLSRGCGDGEPQVPSHVRGVLHDLGQIHPKP